jgi:hypothetical protein
MDYEKINNGNVPPHAGFPVNLTRLKSGQEPCDLVVRPGVVLSCRLVVPEQR